MYLISYDIWSRKLLLKLEPRFYSFWEVARKLISLNYLTFPFSNFISSSSSLLPLLMVDSLVLGFFFSSLVFLWSLFEKRIYLHLKYRQNMVAFFFCLPCLRGIKLKMSNELLFLLLPLTAQIRFSFLFFWKIYFPFVVIIHTANFDCGSNDFLINRINLIGRYCGVVWRSSWGSLNESSFDANDWFWFPDEKFEFWLCIYLLISTEDQLISTLTEKLMFELSKSLINI